MTTPQTQCPECCRMIDLRYPHYCEGMITSPPPPRMTPTCSDCAAMLQVGRTSYECCEKHRRNECGSASQHYIQATHGRCN